MGILLVASALRLAYAWHSHPFFDEYVTILAARVILEGGLPVLPSGLFYEHGLSFSYLDVPWVGLASWLGDYHADALFLLARLPSVLIGSATVWLVYRAGISWFSARTGLLAAALVALAPQAVVWDGRARMYSLAALLAVGSAILVYHGSRGAGNRHLRWLALFVLLLLLLTHFGALIVVPPLVIGAIVVAWLTRPLDGRPWFLRIGVVAEVLALGVVLMLAMLVKRLGQPLGAAPLSDVEAGDLAHELFNVVTYQAGLVLDTESAIKFLARAFGVPHHIWLSIVAIWGGVAMLILRLSHGKRDAPYPTHSYSYQALYLWIISAVPVLEMITLLESWRRNPRYLVIILPWFYLVAAMGWEMALRLLAERRERGAGYRLLRVGGWLAVAALVLLQAHSVWLDLQVAFRTPEPAYERAFAHVRDSWRDGDVLMTMNTPGAALLVGRVDYFAIQEDAEQFLLRTSSADPSRPGEQVDRWMGAPWLGSVHGLMRVLAEHPRAWFVSDTIRLPVYYRGDWLAVLKTQMQLVWSDDEALVFVTRPERPPLPMAPAVKMDAVFGDAIHLLGHSTERAEQPTPGGQYAMTLFWRTDARQRVDYTVFVHVRNVAGTTVAQHDGQPLDGDYPTSRWRPGELVIDPRRITLPSDLPAGEYDVWVGVYRLDTMERLPLRNDSSGENALLLDTLLIQ
ncbi:MAG: glycosyltransferase family 39 protein [Anaerolineae bacterium]|nr:glycosyltransferase family 39 protein [Anaerolineae bacterium]MDW8071003.1 glycosyltransferase family 39 protein [Anaerolineae bacterium]